MNDKQNKLTGGFGQWPTLVATALVIGVGVAAGDSLRLGQGRLVWALWLVPLFVLFNVYVQRKKNRLLSLFATTSLLPALTMNVLGGRRALKSTLLGLGLLCLVVALMEPKWGFRWEEVKRRGVDVMVALDVSDSMLVEDAQEGGGLTRLERAKREIADLLRMMDGDRVGLVAFAGAAFLECPLTLDYGAAEVFLGAIDTDLIPVKGTAIDEAMRVTLDAFEKSASKSKAMILITDGEDHSGAAVALAEKAQEAGVRIFTIGIGRDEGSPIPSPDGGFRRDRRGDLILSKLDETTLQKIALATGGAYVRSVTGDVDLEKVYTQGIKASLEDQELGSTRQQRWEHRFQWFLALAILLLAAEAVISDRRQGANAQALGEKGRHAA